MGMYSSYASFKYEMFALDFGHIVLYSAHGYSNPFLNSISFINNNICHSMFLIVFLNKDYSFSNPELASCTAIKFSHFLNSKQQLLLPRWPEPWHVQQRPWRKSVILLSFSSFLAFESGLYHVSDHPIGLEAVSFLSFPSEPPLVAAEPLLALAEPSLAAEPRELDLQENFKEDCCCLLSCLGNMYIIFFKRLQCLAPYLK